MNRLNFSDQQKPSAFPNVVGVISPDNGTYFIGEEALKNHQTLELHYPARQGHIQKSHYMKVRFRFNFDNFVVFFEILRS